MYFNHQVKPHKNPCVTFISFICLNSYSHTPIPDLLKSSHILIVSIIVYLVQDFKLCTSIGDKKLYQ